MALLIKRHIAFLIHDLITLTKSNDIQENGKLLI